MVGSFPKVINIDCYVPPLAVELYLMILKGELDESNTKED